MPIFGISGACGGDIHLFFVARAQEEQGKGKYWLGTHLMRLLGYPNMQSFRKVIDRATSAILKYSSCDVFEEIKKTDDGNDYFFDPLCMLHDNHGCRQTYRGGSSSGGSNTLHV